MEEITTNDIIIQYAPDVKQPKNQDKGRHLETVEEEA